jgi:hypothetical protein
MVSPLKNAIKATRGDLIMILFPNTVISRSALLRVYGALNRNPSAAWGILGSRHDVSSLKTTCIACINYLRFHLFGIACSTDGIFFQRRVLDTFDGDFTVVFPHDIELSMQLQSFPRTSGSGMITASADYLEDKNIVWYFTRNVWHIFIFLLCRRLGYK